jgi:hypothetical protein
VHGLAVVSNQAFHVLSTVANSDQLTHIGRFDWHQLIQLEVGIGRKSHLSLMPVALWHCDTVTLRIVTPWHCVTVAL